MPDEVRTRNHIIIKYNIAGLLINLLLAVSKILAGTEQERELRELQSVMSSCFPDMQIEINTALNA